MEQQSKKNIYVISFVSFIFWFSNFIYLPILSPYLGTLGGDYGFVGIVLGSYGVMQLLFRLPLGIFSDIKRSRKPFIILGLILNMVTSLIFLITNSLGWTLLARSIAGIGSATWLAFTVLFTSYFPQKELHRAMGLISFIVVLAQLMGTLLSGYIVEILGWKAPFLIGVLFAFVGIILACFIYEPKEGVAKEPIKIKQLAGVVKEPSVLKAALLSIVAHSLIFTTMFGFTSNYALSIGLNNSDISILSVLFMIPHGIAVLYAGKLFVPKFGLWKTFILAFGLAAVSTLSIPFTETSFELYAVQVVNGFSLGLIFPLLLGMAIEGIPYEKQATAMGAYQALYAIGIFAGPFIAGHLNSRGGIATGFYFMGILGIIAMIICIILYKKENKKMF